MILRTHKVRFHFEAFKKIKEKPWKSLFSTARIKHFDGFVSHELSRFVYFFSYLHSCAIWISSRLSLLLIGIYKRMISFFDENLNFHDFFVIYEYPLVILESETNENQCFFMKNGDENDGCHPKSWKNHENIKFHRKMKSYVYKYLLEGGWAGRKTRTRKTEGMKKNTQIFTILACWKLVSPKITEIHQTQVEIKENLDFSLSSLSTLGSRSFFRILSRRK